MSMYRCIKCQNDIDSDYTPAVFYDDGKGGWHDICDDCAVKMEENE